MEDNSKTVYLSADQEQNLIIAEANTETDAEGNIIDEYVTARHNGDTIRVSKEDVDYIDVSPKQIVSIAAASIPFLEMMIPTVLSWLVTCNVRLCLCLDLTHLLSEQVWNIKLLMTLVLL